MVIKNSYYELLLNRGKILSKYEIKNYLRDYIKKFNKKNKNLNDLIKYLSRNNYIKNIFSEIYYVKSFDERNRDFYEFQDQEIIFLALEKLGIKWYIGLYSALYAQGKLWQTPNQLLIINNRFSGIKKILGLKVKFYKIKDSLFFGFKTKITKNKIKYYYSDPAKTYIDQVYLKETNTLKRVKNTKKYLKEYPEWIGKK